MNRRGWIVVAAIIAITVVLSHWLEGGALRGSKSDALAHAIESTACTNPSVIARLPQLDEASGLTASTRHPGILWSHNDSGQPVLHALAIDGQPRARVRIRGASVDDWEGVVSAKCAGDPCLYIGDVGDNGENRKQITIYRVAEPALDEQVTAPADAFHATFPDRPQDAEGIFVAPNEDVFIVTKGREAPVAIYRMPSPLRRGTVATLQRVAVLWSGANKGQRVTDAALAPDGRHVAVRTHDAVLFYTFQEVTSGQPGQPLKIDVRPLKEPQGEGITFANDGTMYLASESGGTGRGGTLARLSCKLP